MAITIDQLANAIYRTEGSANTRWPYGIKQHYNHTTPRQACVNTIIHAEHDWHIVKIDRHFIYLLADRYCPPSVDKQGNLNWKHNMVAILHL
jgi:hypothetical protein